MPHLPRATRLRRRGQAVAELVIILPVMVVLIFAISTYWLAYQHQATYARAAASIAEMTSRAGGISPEMITEIRTQIDDAFGVQVEGVVLHVTAIEPNGTRLAVGDTPLAPVGDPPPAVFDDGWGTAAAQITALPAGTEVFVVIWSHERLHTPLIDPGDAWKTIAAQAAYRVLRGQ
jgi:hypothetical protein